MPRDALMADSNPLLRVPSPSPFVIPKSRRCPMCSGESLPKMRISRTAEKLKIAALEDGTAERVRA